MAFGYWVTPVAGVPGQVDTVQLNPVGKRARSNEGHEYIYLAGVASTVAGAWVSFDELGVTQALDTDVADSLISAVAVATAATVASRWGWYGIDGAFTALAATVADGAKVFPTATAFTCDDTGTGGQQITRAKWRSADSGGSATVEIREPWVGVNVA